MPTPPPREFEGVLRAGGPARYRHFVSRVADNQEILGLRQHDGWVSMGIDDQRLFPVWPAAAYATACAVEEFTAAEATPIDLREWLETWLPNLEGDGSGVAVFPTPSGQGVVVAPAALREHLLAELARIE